MLSRELFETTYRVHNHDKPDRANPFPLATYHPTRANNWGEKHELRRVIKSGAPSELNMSAIDIMCLPVDVYETVLEVCGNINEEDKKALETKGNPELNALLESMLKDKNKK